MDGCLLCLEINKEFEDCIKVNSSQWEKLDIQNLIVKHLWAIETLKFYSCLCTTCWQELYDFHKFYKRVEEAHANNEKLMKIEIGIELLQDEKHNFVTEEYKAIEESENLFDKDVAVEYHVEPEVLIIKEENPIVNMDADDDIPLKQRCKRKCTTKASTHQMEDTSKDPLKKSKRLKCKTKKAKKYTTKPIKLKKSPLNEEDYKQSDINISTNKLEISKEHNLPTNDYVEPDENNLETSKENSLSSNYNDDTDPDETNFLESDLESNENNSYHNPYYKPRTNRHKYDGYISENMQISCTLCQIPVETFSAIIKHFHVVHKQRGYIMCCKRKFFDRSDIVDHIHVHRNPEHFKCNDCGKVLADRSCLRLHMKKIHEGIVEKNVHCDVCGKVLANKHGLRIHKHVMHEVKDDDRLPCTECKKTFRNKVSLSQHIKTVHLRKYVKICDLCGKSIAEKDKFQRHMLEHEGKPVPTVSCTICGRRYTDKRSLRRHMNLQHPTEKTEYNCHICLKKFASMDNVKKHIKTVHELSYVNKCTICEKTFRRPDALRDHMARHTGTPLHSCPWCPKEFYSNGQMHAHRKEAHPKEWEDVQRQKFSGNLPPKYKPTEMS